MLFRRPTIALLLLACALLAASPALVVRADGVADEAEINFRLGAERYQAGDFRGALALFLASQRLVPNRNVRFNIVRTFQRLAMYPEAYRWCEEALHEETEPAMRSELQQLLALIERDVAVLEVTSDPPGATIYVDRLDLGSLATTPARLALQEGEHQVILQLDGYRRAEPPVVRVKKHEVVELAAQLERIVGLVQVDASAPTELRVDTEGGVAQCKTPCQLELAPGPHVLYFRRAGFRVAPRQVRVQAGQRAQLSVEAQPLTGSIVVTTDVRDARIEVDGAAVGFTPTVIKDVPVGKRKLLLTLAGYEPLQYDVEVREDQVSELGTLPLVPVRQVTAAARVSQSVDEAPASVSVVSAQELEAFRYPTIAEALRGQRGVAIANDGVYTGLTIRGLGQPGDYGNRVLVLSDGATLNDNILWQSYVGYDGRVDLGDLERIELVRGPGSVLYGTGAVSGLVNLVPKALPDRPSSELRIQANDARTARARASYAMPLGARRGFLLSLAGGHSDGQRVDLPAPVSRSVDHVERFDAMTAQTRARWKDLSLQGFVTYRDQDIPAGAYGAVVGDSRNWVRDTRGLLELRYEPELVPTRLRLYARAFANQYRFDSEQAFASDGTQGVSVVEERYRGVWFGAEARLVGELTTRIRLTVGSELQASTTARLHGDATMQGVRSRTLGESMPYQTYAGYAVVDVKLTPQVTASAGARVDAWSTFGATVNPRLNLLVMPDARNIIKLVAGRAFRAPSLYELRYSDQSTQLRSDFNGNKLGPELSWSGELEYTHRFLEQWAVVGAGHVQYAEGLIKQTFSVPGDSSSPVYYRNSDSAALTVGGDVELRRELYRGLLFASTYGYLYPRYIAERPLGSTRLPNAPAHYGSFRVIVPVWAETRLALRSSLESPRRISSLTVSRTNPAVITDVVFSGRIGDSGFDFAVGVYNLFDFRVALPTDPTFQVRTMPQPGRTLLMSLGLRI